MPNLQVHHRMKKFGKQMFPPNFHKPLVWLIIFSCLFSSGNVFAQNVRPGVADYVDGELEILHEDGHQGSRYSYFLKSGGRRLLLNFANDAPTHLTSGARVRVRGVRTNGTLALAGGGNGVQTLSAAPALNSFGEQRTLVMLVNFADNPAQPWSRDTVNQAIFGKVSAFISENSYGATWLAGDVTGWLTISLSSSLCDTTSLASQAQQAAQAAGWMPTNYQRLIYAFPQNACGFGGASFIGGSPSQAWLNGDISLRIAGHEFGHGLGLWHSHSMDCGDVSLGSTCTTQEYGDTLDVMGTASTAHFNSFQKERLGWITPLTVTQSGTYILDAYEFNASAIKTLKSIDSTTGARTWYYLEARKQIGFDNTLTYQGMTNGVAIRLGSESSGNMSYMLDMTPNSFANDGLDPTLPPGYRFSDPAAGVTIVTDWVTANQAAVTVGVSLPPSTAPTVTVVTDQPSYTGTQTVSITTTMTSGGSPVPGASVTFTITKSSGAKVMANATTGSNGAAVYKLRLKKQDPLGTYQVGAVAKKDSLTGSGSTQFTVR